MSKENENFVKKCMSLDKKIRKVLNGEETAVGVQVLTVALARVIVECCKDEKHSDAAIAVMGTFMDVMAKMSDTFIDEIHEKAVAVPDVVEMMQADAETKH